MIEKRNISAAIVICAMAMMMSACGGSSSAKPVETTAVVESTVMEGETTAAEKEAAAAEKETTAAEKETAVAEKETTAAEKETAATEKETTAAEKETIAAEKENSAEEKESMDADHAATVENPVLTVDEIVGPWHLSDTENNLDALNEAFPGAMEFGSSMEIRSDGRISWYVGAEGGSGTYTIDGRALDMSYTDDLDGKSMNLRLESKESGSALYLTMNYKDFAVVWQYGDREDSNRGEEEVGEEETNEEGTVDESWKTEFEASLMANYGVEPHHYEDLGDGVYQVYVEIDGQVVPYVTVDSKTGDYHG